MRFLRKYFIFIFLAFVATSLFTVKLFLSEQTKSPPNQGVSPLSWKGIVPGKTTIDETENILGAPASSEKAGTGIVLKYETGVGGPPHTVVVEDQTVGLIKERFVGDEALDDFKKQHGNPDGEFWGPYKEVGFKFFVFSLRGVAVLANQLDGVVLEVWYFEPTTLDGFLKKWGVGLETEPKTGF